jgi:hypothetical protein
MQRSASSSCVFSAEIVGSGALESVSAIYLKDRFNYEYLILAIWLPLTFLLVLAIATSWTMSCSK